MAKRPNKHPRPVFKAKSKKPSLGFLVAVSLAVVLVAATVLYLSFGGSKSGGARNPTADGGRETNARQLDYEVANSYPHDPAAFLQGLLWYQGGFYESTGLYGQSTLRRIEFPSGKILKSINLPAELFGEGLALAGNRLVQLEWKSKRGFVYDRDSFALLREFRYDSEGWGITYDGKYLIMSDGSSKLTYLDANSFAAVRTLGVTMNGRPIDRLNELEFIEGEIWSNVWQTDLVLRIDPGTGKVTSFLNLNAILPASLRTGTEDVLNGIAYDAQQKRIFVSGKLWPRIFEIRVK